MKQSGGHDFRLLRRQRKRCQFKDHVLIPVTHAKNRQWSCHTDLLRWNADLLSLGSVSNPVSARVRKIRGFCQHETLYHFHIIFVWRIWRLWKRITKKSASRPLRVRARRKAMGMSSESHFARPDAQGECVELPPPKNRAWQPCTQRWAKEKEQCPRLLG